MGPRQYGSKHFFLNINGNDLPAVSYEPSHWNGEKTDAGTYIHNGVPGPDERTHDSIRVLKKPADPVIEGEAKPAGANMVLSHKQEIAYSAHDIFL
jgi:hypothetical protein